MPFSPNSSNNDEQLAAVCIILKYVRCTAPANLTLLDQSSYKQWLDFKRDLLFPGNWVTSLKVITNLKLNAHREIICCSVLLFKFLNNFKDGFLSVNNERMSLKTYVASSLTLFPKG